MSVYIRQYFGLRTGQAIGKSKMDMLYLTLTVAVLIGLAEASSIPIAKFKKQLLDVHNEYRRQQHGADMQELEWDDELSNIAAGWIKQCRFDHQRKGYGENLAFDTNPKPSEELINSSMKLWYDEIKDYRGGSCAPMSCHYTQLVWATTDKVGCAIEKCNYLSAFGSGYQNAWYLGCWYTPRGNMGTKSPFEPGKGCSHCRSGQTCDKGLCHGSSKGSDEGSGQGSCQDSNKNCAAWSKRGECAKNPNWMSTNCQKSCNKC